MSHLKIFRASAGSGKTYTLTGAYIHLLFNNPADYHKVLAVTFTNKATAEMRSRILENLYNLSDTFNPEPDHLQDLMNRHQLTEKQVRSRAALILRFLLHDYSRFSVSTIDSFFQSIVRSFAKEMGLPIGFKLELQPNQIMTQAIDRVILEMDQPGHADLKNWLIEFVETKMEQDQGWNITREIRQISEAIYSEIFQENAVALWKELGDKGALNEYKQTLRQIIRQADHQLQLIGQSALDMIKQYGLNISEDFYRKSTSPVKVFLKMDSLKTFVTAGDFEMLIDNVDRWVRKDNPKPKNEVIVEAFTHGLNQKLKASKELLLTVGPDYFSASAILENLNALGIVTDVSLKMAELCREKNLFLISGTNHLLSRIIDNNDTPFIYEKTGARFSHFMIDEFQDTSSLQYLNFKPLINESLSSRNSTLLVGDVKQAIYRWRNSDWNLLAEQVEKDFAGFGYEARNLDVNWRSLEEIIGFNNHFFSKASGILQNAFNSQIPEGIQGEPFVKQMARKITGAYEDVVQKTAPNKLGSGGNVFIKLLEGTKKETEEDIVRLVVQRVWQLTESGQSLSDLCILVRSNQEGVLLTNALLSGTFHPTNTTIPVISSESLILNGSESIKLIIHQIRFLQNPGDQVTESFIKLIWSKNSFFAHAAEYDATFAFDIQYHDQWQHYRSNLIKLQEKPLYELTESLVRMLPPELIKHECVYIQAFTSMMLGFINDETADLNAFLEYWDKNCEKFSLNVPENQQAIKVMTIHKSKGLEFKSVIIPFFSWELTSNHSSLLWIKPELPPFNQMTLVPVASKKELLRSHFSREYLFEVLQQYIDNLNLSYVAFTRARESLSVFGNIRNKEIKEIHTVADLLFHFLLNHADPSLLNDDKTEFNCRMPVRIVAGKEKRKIREQCSVEINELSSFPFKEKVKMHLESAGFFNEDETVRQVDYGKIMHQLFESITVTEDIEPALKALRFKGMITLAESITLQAQATEWLCNDRVKSWFDGTYRIKTEAGILWGQQKRPDRIMIGENHIIVVDYKFGHKKSDSHIEQVQEYIHLIRQMGYSMIEGYLWYLTMGEILEVPEESTLFG